MSKLEKVMLAIVGAAIGAGVIVMSVLLASGVS